jgi:anti-anti-sigma factor
MSLLVGNDPSWPVARLSGEIDLSNVDDLTAALEQTVGNGAMGLVVDLTDVTYLDSTGVRLLFRLARQLRDRQQTLHLVVPDRARTRRILELSGVLLVATTTPTLPDINRLPQSTSSDKKEPQGDGSVHPRR